MKSLLLVPPLVILGILVVLATRDGEEAKPEATGEFRSTDQLPTPHRISQKIEWQKICEEFESGSLSGQIDETSAFGRFMNEIAGMSPVELMTLRQDLAAVEMSAESCQRLNIQITGTLLRKDPEFALGSLTGSLSEAGGETAMMLLGGFRDWAMKFPSKAEVWLDRQIQTGAFGSEGDTGAMQTRLNFERELIRALLPSGPDRPAARLEALPESDRVTALRGSDTPLGRAAYVALVHRYLPEPEQEREFARMVEAARYLKGDAAVEVLLQQIEAGGWEREGTHSGESDEESPPGN